MGGQDDATVAAGSEPALTVVVLTWNRVDLLARCLAALGEHTRARHTVTVVDNGSDEPAPSVIDPFCAAAPGRAALYLERGPAGAAIEAGLRAAAPLAPLVFVCENDYEVLPGWDAGVLADFAAFPELGVLGLLGRAKRRGMPLERDGRRVWPTPGNTTTTQVARRAVYDAGARWRSLPAGYRLPADSAFCADARAAGFVVARPDRSRAVNHGHTLAEFRHRLPYYLDNYAGKPGGLERFAARVAAAGGRLVQESDGAWAIEAAEPGNGERRRRRPPAEGGSTDSGAAARAAGDPTA